MIDQNDNVNWKQRLACACHTKANAAFGIADYVTALECYSREIVLYEELSAHLGEEISSLLLADCYMSKGNTIWASGNPKGAIIWHDKAISIWDHMVNEGRDDLSGSLAKGCYNKAITLDSDGKGQQAVEWLDRGIRIYERLVHEQGQWQIANELANVYIGRANAVNNSSQNREALIWFEKAIEIYNALASQQGRQEFTGDLARVRGLYASTLIEVGEHDSGMLEADRALPALERELARTERSDLKVVLRILKEALQRHQ